MVMFRRSVFILVCLVGVNMLVSGEAACAEDYLLRSESCSASFDSVGTLLSLGRTPEEALARLVSLRIYDRTSQAKTGPRRSPCGPGHTISGSGHTCA